MLYDTVAKYNTAIDATQAAIDRQLGIGSSGSTSTAGNSWQFTEVPFKVLQERIVQLKRERDMLKRRFLFMKPGW